MINSKQIKNFVNNIKNNGRDLEWLGRAIITGYFRRIVGNKGVYVMEEDWDNLLILDACRYDLFDEVNNISGRLEFRISRGSTTNEFLIENFKGKKFYDTVYIAANPLVNYHVGNSFYKTVHVWKNGWDEEYDTVLPKTMVEYTLKAQDQYPNKRLIVHFVQPHYPFIGKKGEKIGNRADLAMTRDEVLGHENPFDRATVWDLLREGKLDKGTIWEAYKENLQIVLSYAKTLVEKLNGKTIITTDHGNSFGEWVYPFPIREYGHHGEIYIENLVKVPWLVIEKEKRKKIIEERKSAQMRFEKTRIKAAISRLKNI